ncbi:MAG: iron-containing redox enzyme family protein [Burkholderiaceae bacterium]
MNAPTENFLAFKRGAETRDELHRRLALFNRRRTLPAFPTADWRLELDEEDTFRFEEGSVVEEERRAVAEAVMEAPHDADAFVQWFEQLAHTGPGQGDPLFQWLATEANLDQMRWFLTQEVAGEAGFDDLVALTQVRMPIQAKLEMARNYWDEMGRGKRVGMHGPMLELAVKELQLDPTIDTTVWESLALCNVMMALAYHRQYAFQSVGALGVIELTAPGRVSLVEKGLARLGVSSAGRRYFQLHANLDVAHSREWNREIIRPLVAADARCARALAEGALMRLRCGARCFERYRAEFGLA